MSCWFSAFPPIISGLHAASDTRRTYVVMIIGTVLFIALAFLGPFTWWHGLILLSLLAYVLFDAARAARAHRAAANGAPSRPRRPGRGRSRHAVVAHRCLSRLGLIGLPLGADLLVDSSIAIATVYGVSETVIGLTLVAIGTSLPELATTVMAAIRKHADVALGNVIGSNMFNLLAIIGISSLVGPIPVEPGLPAVRHLGHAGRLAGAGAFVFLRWSMGRIVGIVFTALYVGYIAMLLA
jgi:cation:H+ antiporter